jgi:hypothetical protein
MAAYAVFVCLVALAAVSSGQITGLTGLTTIGLPTATLGVATSVSANAPVTLNFGLLGPSLNITVSQDAQVTLSAYANVFGATDLPSGFLQLQFSAATGFTLDVTPSTAVVSATLKTPALTAATSALLSGSTHAGCLKYDADANWFVGLPVQSVDTLLQTMTVKLPGVGTYLFAAVDLSAAVPVTFDFALSLTAAAAVTLQYKNGLGIDVTASVDSSIQVSHVTASPHSGTPTSATVSVGQFFVVDVSNNASVSATIRYKYTDADLKANGGVKAETLRFGFYNEVTAKWELPATGGSVDINTQTVVQTTTHFSTWGIWGEYFDAELTFDSAPLNSFLAATPVALAALVLA